MKRIKTFEIKAEPTAKGGGREHLAVCIDADVNKWLEENPGIREVEISHSADTASTYKSAVVILAYDDGATPDEASGDEPKRRGRPPKE